MKYDHDGFGGDGFDWMDTLADAGIHSRCRDLSHLPTNEVVALLAREEQAGIALARSVGLPQEEDAFNRPIPVEMSDRERADLLEGINAVVVTKDHLAAVMRIVDLIPSPLRFAGPAPAFTVLEYVEDQGLADPALSRALLARAIALARWRADHAGRVVDAATLMEAAARTVVICRDGLPAFDGEAFSGLVEFLAELPW